MMMIREQLMGDWFDSSPYYSKEQTIIKDLICLWMIKEVISVGNHVFELQKMIVISFINQIFNIQSKFSTDCLNMKEIFS